MRYIGKHKNKKVRERQVGVFVEMLSELKDKTEIRWFLESLVSPSEIAYIAQRLEIMRMVKDGGTYNDIKINVGTTDGTISATKDQLDGCDKKFHKLLGLYNLNKQTEGKKDNNKECDDNKYVKANYPGAIRMK